VAADSPLPNPAAQAALTLVSGPSASGKSRWAEHLAGRSGRSVVYLATGPCLPEDAGWQRRLERHRRRRPPHWLCREVGGDLAGGLARLESAQLGLVDSLGTWVAAHLDSDDGPWQERCEDLLGAIGACAAPLILVCEETGWGVVPPTRAGGRFRDRLGTVQGRITAVCDAAWLVVMGRAIDLLACSQPVPPDPFSAAAGAS
jgi:adenosylcobinamide kinase/adenosylcobinamide-phosphate guanylyltransferase